MEKNKLEYVERIANSLAKKSEFDIYDKDDIQQEIFFLVMQAESRYDKNKGDEYTFYFNYVKNRLSTLKRDKYGVNLYKMQIADAITLEGDVESLSQSPFLTYQNVIDEKIQANMRADYLRFIEGVKIPHRNKMLLIEAIQEIIRIYNKESDDDV